MKSHRSGERGVALFISIFALLLLTGIAAALLFTATTETSVDSNYRNEQVAYFAAKAGVEEARSRAMTSDPNSISTFMPTVAPNTGNYGVLYIVNSASGTQPWLSTDTYADDELCHDGYDGLGYTGLPPALAIMAPDIRCIDSSSGHAILPSGGTWYKSFNSTIPFAGTSKALTYEWSRIAPKLNDSVSYLQGSGSTATTSTYLVHPVSPVPPVVTADNLICWDGQEELPLTAGDTLCSQMVSIYNSVPTTQVYLATSMGVASNGARKMVQSEIALQPTTPFPYGLYATSTACPAISFTGNNPSTNSYTTAGGQTYGSSQTATGGDIGSNGAVSVGNGNVGGTVGVLAPGVSCATPVSVGSQGSMVGTTTCPSGVSTQCYMPQPYSFPTPPAPSPAPPNTSYSPPSCGHGHSSGNCMTAGTYGNIDVNGTLYLAPGVYNINSFSMQGNGAIIVSPPGAVTLNIAGNGQSSPLSIAGNGVTDDTIPNDFTINYSGTGSISVTGNGDVTAILNAPLATVTQSGNGNWYGSMVMATATIGGNAFFHYDQNASLAPNNNGYYTMISYRLVPY
jgi:hypothetical protein